MLPAEAQQIRVDRAAVAAPRQFEQAPPEGRTDLLAASPRKRSPKGGTTGKDDKTEKPAQPAWPKDSLNLDSMKYTRDFSSGFLLAGAGGADWGSLLSGAALDANNLPAILQMFGRGIAVIFGFVAVIIATIIQAISRMFMPVESAGARPGEGRRGGLSSAMKLVAFIVGAIIGLVIPLDGGGSSSAGDTKKALTLVPVHSNEFLFHVLLPEPIKKEKFKEKFGDKDLPYSIVGYRDEAQRKNEMAIGYAHLPSVEEMIKEKEAVTQPLLPGGPVPVSKPVYYFDSQKALDAAVTNMEKQGHIKVTFKCACVLPKGKLPGRELEGTATDGRMVRTRIYLGYNNAYQIIVAGDQSFVNSNDAFKFLDSLAVGESI